MQILSILFIYSNPFINNIYICAKVITSTVLFVPVFIVYPDAEYKTLFLACPVAGSWLLHHRSSSAPIRAGSREEWRVALVGPWGKERCGGVGHSVAVPSQRCHPTAVLPSNPTAMPGALGSKRGTALRASSLLLTYQNRHHNEKRSGALTGLQR